jgi:predicted nucleotidyltransferase
VKRKLKLAEEYVEELRERYTLRLAILFGSLARDEWTEHSDVDLLVVADELSDDPLRNYVELKEYGVEPIGFSTRGVFKEIERINFVLLDALEYGRILYKDKMLYEFLMEKFREIKERYGLVRDDKGWIWRIDR